MTIPITLPIVYPATAMASVRPASTPSPATIHDRPWLRKQIRVALKTLPMMEVSDGGELNFNTIRSVRECIRRGIKHSRLEKIHLLLCGDRKPQDVRVIDNGPGLFLHNVFALAQLGSRILIKEVPRLCSLINQSMDMDFPPDLRSSVSVAHDINKPTPANIVYWANPDLGMVSQYGLNYMGRDVVAGGFMVIQTDDTEGIRFHPDRSAWRTIYRRLLDGKYGKAGNVLQTGFVFEAGFNLFLILQRK